MRTTPEETQKNDKRILEAAIRVFTEKGYADTNMQDIADELGITKGPLYYRYRTKADLFEAALRQSAEEQLAGFEQILAEDRPFKDTFRDILRFGTRNFMTERYAMSEMALRGHSERPADMEDILRHYTDQLQQKKIDFIHRAIEKGELRRDTNIQQLLVTLSVYSTGLYYTIHDTRMITNQEEINACIEDALFLIMERCGAE